jgi:hypothetical protein
MARGLYGGRLAPFFRVFWISRTQIFPYYGGEGFFEEGVVREVDVTPKNPFGPILSRAFSGSGTSQEALSAIWPKGAKKVVFGGF